MANHASTRTTQLYNPRRDEAELDEVKRIVIDTPSRQTADYRWVRWRRQGSTLSRHSPVYIMLPFEAGLFADRSSLCSEGLVK